MVDILRTISETICEYKRHRFRLIPLYLTEAGFAVGVEVSTEDLSRTFFIANIFYLKVSQFTSARFCSIWTIISSLRKKFSFFYPPICNLAKCLIKWYLHDFLIKLRLPIRSDMFNSIKRPLCLEIVSRSLTIRSISKIKLKLKCYFQEFRYICASLSSETNAMNLLLESFRAKRIDFGVKW